MMRSKLLVMVVLSITVIPNQQPTNSFAYLPFVANLYSNIWRPPVEATWQIQFSVPIDTTINVQIYDIDLFDSDPGLVSELHAKGRRVICYLSAGSWEDWRPDAGNFPKEIIGKDYGGWPGEKWLDIRRIDLLGPILLARLDLCKAKGFDGVDPDNVDGYSNDTGFPLTYQDQITFNAWLANEAHNRSLSVGLKNDADQVHELLPLFDWSLTEDCFAQGWCDQVVPFIQAGKPVFSIEYTDTGMTLEKFCPQAKTLKFSPILKKRNLDAWVQYCS